MVCYFIFTILMTVVVFGGSTPYVAAAETVFTAPPADQILRTLKPTHPRLLVADGTFARMKVLVQTDSIARRCYEKIKSSADRILKQAPSHYEIPDGKRLLGVSRRVKKRVRTLAFVYRMGGDRRYVDRAWAELEAAAKFKDWNPSHFLDTAEMTHAFAIGYDWLYHEWSDGQRRVLREAIITHGLQPAMKVYRRGRGWARGHNNWTQVCNGGIGMGALAIADVEPALAADILHEGMKSIPRAMAHYAPDGAGTEGVTYWDYGSRYNILFLASLETALGTDFGLSQIEGFSRSGDYAIYMSDANGMSFNFSDCGLRRVSTPQHFWMGRKYNIPRYSWYRYSGLRHPKSRGDVLDLLWFDDSAKDFDMTALPLDRYFRGAECASMRSAWGDPNALVLGIQAGDNNNLRGHRHLDLGSFILEALGERWAIDSGVEKETYQTHRNKRKRWEFYRVRAEGHNTLVINPGGGPDQNLRAFAKIVKFESAPDRALAVVDLSDAYARHVRRVQRTYEMVDRSYIIVTDEVEADKPAGVWWFMHTWSDVKLSEDKTTATLGQNGKYLSVEIVEPKGAGFDVMDAAPLPSSPNPEKQADNTGRRKLAIHLADVTKLKLVVKMTPVYEF